MAANHTIVTTALEDAAMRLWFDGQPALAELISGLKIPLTDFLLTRGHVDGDIVTAVDDLVAHLRDSEWSLEVHMHAGRHYRAQVVQVGSRLSGRKVADTIHGFLLRAKNTHSDILGFRIRLTHLDTDDAVLPLVLGAGSMR